MTGDAYRKILRLAESLTDEERLGVIRSLQPKTPANRRIDADINAWCREHNTTWAEMRGRGRRRSVGELRQRLYAHLIRWYSSVEVGIALNRDHSTVLQGVDAHYARVARRAA